MLDVGCGAGQYGLYLQECGLEVVGIDESPLSLEACRKLGLRDVQLVNARVMSVEQLGLFDTILLFGHNLGIGGTPNGVRALLKNLLNLTRENGRILLNSFDKTLDPKDKIRKEIVYSQSVGRHIGQIRHKAVFEEYDTGWFDWIHISPDELKVWTEPLGWRVGQVFWGTESGKWRGILENQLN